MIVTASDVLPQKEVPAWSIYQSCDDLPLTAFVKCLVSGDYSGLVITGTPPLPDIEEAWLTIYSDYCDRIGGIQIASMIEKTRMINALSSKIERVQTLVTCARAIICETLINELVAEPGMKVSRAKLTGSSDEYHRELDTILARLKPDIMKLDRLTNDMPKGDSKPATTQDFTKTLLEVSKQEGYQVRMKDITVAEYCEYVRRLREHIESLNRAQIKSKRNGR